MRALECDLAYLEKADGSAMLCQGDTKVISAVYGPAEVKINKEIVDKATVQCILKPKVGMTSVKEKVIEETLTKTCEQAILRNFHPRSAVQIVLQIMHDDGSLLSCLINAACLSMVHAGIPMRNMIVAVCCAVTNDDEYLVDPTKIQMQKAKCVMTFSLEFRNLDVVSTYTTGIFTDDQFFKCLQMAKVSAKDVSSFQRQTMIRFLSKDNYDDEEVQDMDE